MANDTETTETPKKPRGRPIGSVNRRSQMARDIVERLGVDPLEALLKIVKNRRLAIELRLDAAKAAVPFVHARLTTSFVAARVQTDVRVTRQLQELAGSDPQLAKAMETLSLRLTEMEYQAKRESGQIIDVESELLSLPPPVYSDDD